MEPTAIIQKPVMFLAGMSFFGDPFTMSAEWTEENEIGRLWNRFFAYLKRDPSHSDEAFCFQNSGVSYEAWIEHAETAPKGQVEVFVGMEVESVASLPVELLVKVFPVATYAVFTLQGEAIMSDWNHGVQQWMAAAGYQQAYPYGLQVYDERFKGLDKVEESELDAYVPVKRS